MCINERVSNTHTYNIYTYNSPDTVFSGYSVPHPSEEVMNVRLQTNTITTDKALRKAFSRISKITEILTDKYSTALNEHDKHQQ